ncbi:hypothetical protein [Nocardioides plantarum]|uniref:Uncharacterized protein n=1 Tax=Nocardioides plantarum TaxID=29299 RepID=A0ABV5K423_9ACTN|nr:hypothetical protein [Nocardioides plantarum]
MPDDERPSLEAPQLFGRRRTKRQARADVPAADAEHGFEDSGSDATEVVPVVPADEPDATAVLPAQPAAPRRPRRERRTPGGDVDVVDAPGTVTTDDTDDTAPEAPSKPVRAPRTPPTPRDRSTPLLPGRPAAVLSGLGAGLALLGFTWLGFQGCEAARGTSSCGTGPGMVALVVVFVLAVAVGAVVLSQFDVPDPGATSFLGTGLTGVVYLLLVEQLDNWTVLVVVPVVTALTFLLSWWVTTTYVDTD